MVCRPTIRYCLISRKPDQRVTQLQHELVDTYLEYMSCNTRQSRLILYCRFRTGDRACSQQATTATTAAAKDTAVHSAEVSAAGVDELMAKGESNLSRQLFGVSSAERGWLNRRVSAAGRVRFPARRPQAGTVRSYVWTVRTDHGQRR